MFLLFLCVVTSFSTGDDYIKQVLLTGYDIYKKNSPIMCGTKQASSSSKLSANKARGTLDSVLLELLQNRLR